MEGVGRGRVALARDRPTRVGPVALPVALGEQDEAARAAVVAEAAIRTRLAGRDH